MATSAAEPDPAERRRAPMRSRRWWATRVVAIIVIAGACVVAVAAVLDRSRADTATAIDNRAATSLAVVQRRTLSTQTQFNGTLGYAGSYTVVAQRPGTVTWLPSPGQVVRYGHVLYAENGAPTVLLHGSVPAFRALAAGATAAAVIGPDVAQLNHDLVTMGYIPKADVDAAWDEFSWATTAGVRGLQRHLGIEQTGRLARGAIVFLPTVARVSTVSAILGAPVSGRVLTATSTLRVVIITIATGERSEVAVGDQVTITMPNNRSSPGTVTSLGTVGSTNDSRGSGPVVPVTIALNARAATVAPDPAPVLVSITNRTVFHVLAVPVTALLALAGGGYAVEVVTAAGNHHLEPVIPGLFDDEAGLVQVSSSDLAPGQHVVVPGS